MDKVTLTHIRITRETKSLINIPLEKTMAILASEHCAIHGNLEDIKLLETDDIVTTITKLSRF